MRTIKLFTVLLSAFCLFGMNSCADDEQYSENNQEIEIVKSEEDIHYLKFIENNVEILRIVVLENETYEDIRPFFPTLTEEEGYIKYWDGDYEYTDYSIDNQFVVYSQTNFIIEIYAYMKKIS